MDRHLPRSVTVAAIAGALFVVSVCPVASAAATEVQTDHELERTTVDDSVTTVEHPTAPLQTNDDGHHLTAVLGIVLLFVLGSALVARNRLRSRSQVDRRPSSPRTEEFLTDREKVRQLVKENGGRMKQADIVDSVEWSKAKVSRLLADLESDGEITKLRLGRENLICLDGFEPPASKPSESPEHE